MMLNKLIKLFSKNKLLFISILFLIVFSVLARFTFLDRFPGGMDPDTTEVVLSSKSVFLFGADSSGTSIIKMLFSNDTKAGIAGLPSIILSPLIGGLDMGLSGARAVFVFINLLTILFISLIMYEVSKNEKLALISLVVGLFNPWFFAYSRVPTEAPFALFVIIVGLFLYYKYPQKIYLSLISFVLAFYSYFGAKPLVLLIFPTLLLISFFKNKRRHLNKYLIYFFTFLALTIPYFFLSKDTLQDTFSRRNSNEILISNIDIFSGTVNQQRRASMSTSYQSIFYNKYVEAANVFINKYVGWLSQDFLIGGGDSRGIYRFGDHGMILAINLPFLILGFSQLVTFPVLLVILLLSPIPSALSLNGDSYFFRSFLLIPIFTMAISFGIDYFSKFIKKTLKGIFYILMILTNIVLFSFFLNFYFFRYPVDQHRNNYLEGRIISSYIKRLEETKEVIVITTSPYSVFNELVFYNDLLKSTKNLLGKEKMSYSLRNVSIVNKCPEELEDKIYFIDSKLDCDIPEKDFTVIQDQSDAGVTFKIYNDLLCENYNKEFFRSNHLISDYAIEKLETDIFCQRWVQKGF